MNRRGRSVPGGLTLAVVTAVLIAGCASPGSPDDSGGASPGETSTGAPITTPDASPAPPAETPEPTCETLVSGSLVDELTGLGWTAKEDAFTAGADPIEDGIQCTWANYDGPSSDNVLVFGWAPVESSEAGRMQSDLMTQGWLREDGPEGIYLTADPDYVVAADENGYGMTYLFGDGWVKLASTKQGLLLIEWPPAG